MIHAAPERFEGLQSKRLEIKSRDFSKPLVCSLLWSNRPNVGAYGPQKETSKYMLSKRKTSSRETLAIASRAYCWKV